MTTTAPATVTPTVVVAAPPNLDREQHLTVRGTGVRGTEVAAVLDMSKYTSAHEVYLDKRGELPLDRPPAPGPRRGWVLGTGTRADHRPRVLRALRPRRRRGPGNARARTAGLHFACVWVEGRVLDEDTEPEQQLDGALAAPP